MNKAGLIYDVSDKPSFGKLLVFALQQVLAIMAATIAVPTIIGKPAYIPAALLGAGIGTIVYLLFTKFKSPVFLGSSFAFLSSLFTAVAYGYCGIILGSIFAGLVYVVIALVIHFVGTNWVSKLMPPVIIGPTVALIGLSLAVNAMGDMVKANASQINGGYNLVGLVCGLVAFFTIVICSTQKKFKMMKLIPFIIGIGAGYAVAAIFTAIGYLADADYLMIINFEPLIRNFVNADGSFVGFTAFLNYPEFALISGIKEIANGTFNIDGGAVAEIAIAFLPVAFVVFAEHIADHKNLSSIIGKDLIKDPGLKRTLLGDGVGSIAGTIFGICPNTTYGESVGCVAITKNASVYTILTAAIMCICLSFVSPIMALLRTIPSCVMGGVCLTLYGYIAVSGLKMFKDLDLNKNRNLFVVSAILIAGIGGLSIQIPYTMERAFSWVVSSTGIPSYVDSGFANVITVTPIATALILGIVTNLILSKIEKKQGDAEEESLVTAAADKSTCDACVEENVECEGCEKAE
ncbi:MAG: uracil-xanthine permease [Clostridiales bacterium]|nr:uracil-xanthine permease [Clostridiales bacterium]